MQRFSPDQIRFALLLAAIIIALTLYRTFFQF
jgi:hypothetical protein